MKKPDKKRVLDALSAIGDLPTLPIVAMEVSKLLEDPSTRPRDITEVMKSDQVVTSKVLKVVNSPYYGIRGGVTSVEKAVRYLGYNTIYQLLIGISVMEFSRLGGEAGLDINEFWKHALAVAVASEVIAQRAGFDDPKELFAAGLLHDLGKLGLAKVAKKQFEEAVALARKEAIDLKEAEKRVGLPSHDRVGAVLADKWRIPMVLKAAISMHHLTYEVRKQTVSKNVQHEVDVIILANSFAKMHEMGDSGHVVIPELDKALVERLGLHQDDLDQIKGEMARKVEASKIFLSFLEKHV